MEAKKCVLTVRSNMDYGFIYEEPKQEDYLFGDASIDAPVLQPDGQWDAFLPSPEYQNLNGVEPYACATFTTTNCVEILLNRVYAFKDNYSDRFLAKMSGTAEKHGNSPHVVAETLRHMGDVDEYVWPFTSGIDTFEKYYSAIPNTVTDKALVFTDHYDFRHDYVPNDQVSMMEALKYSPLGMSVFGWNLGSDGIYQAGRGMDNHFVTVYGYEDGKYWKVFDSYDNEIKKLAWDHRPLTVKRYHIELSTQTKTWFSEALKKIRAFFHV